MTKGKIIYWLSTSLLCTVYVAAAIIYLVLRPMVEEGFRYFGYPTYLITLLIVAKITAPLAIMTRFSVWLSDLAYAGMFYHLGLATLAHLNADEGGSAHTLVLLVLLIVSFVSQNLGRKVASPNAPIVFGPTTQGLARQQ